MPDDVLRMRATIVSEEALANIRAIGREIGMLPRNAGQGVKNVNQQFVTLSGTIRNLGKETLSVVPALRGLGFGAAGLGVAAYSMISTLSNVSKKMVELKFSAEELGLSTQALRGFTTAAEQVGIAPEAMSSGLQSFKRNTEDFSLRMGEVRKQLIEVGAAPVLSRINAASTELDKLHEAFDFKEVLMEADPSGMKARRFFEMIGLGADKARLSWDKFIEAKEKEPVLSEEDMKRAQEFRNKMVDLSHVWDNVVARKYQSAGRSTRPRRRGTRTISSTPIHYLAAPSRLD